MFEIFLKCPWSDGLARQIIRRHIGKTEWKQDSPYSTPNTVADEVWVCAVLEYVPVTSVKLAVHFCDQSAVFQLCEKAQGNNPESLQKAPTFRATVCSVIEGFFLMACWCRCYQKDEMQSQMQHAFLSQFAREITLTFSLIRCMKKFSHTYRVRDWIGVSRHDKQGLFRNIIITTLSVWDILLIDHRASES